MLISSFLVLGINTNGIKKGFKMERKLMKYFKQE